MKKLLCLLAAGLVLLSGCEKPFEGPQKPQKDWKPQSESEEAKPQEVFYPCEKETFDGGDFYYVPTQGIWNFDGSLTFQNGESLVTLSPENEIISEVTLPKNPNSNCTPKIYPVGDYIIASHVNENSFYDGRIYHTYNGKINLVNTTLYRKNGELVREYPVAYGASENGNWQLPVDSNDIVMGTRDTASDYIFHWAGGNKAFVEFYDAFGIYDFEKDEGKVICTAKSLGKREGYEKPYLGGHCGVMNGKLWFTVENTEEGLSNHYLYYADESGYAKVCDGYLLFCDEKGVLIQRKDGVYIAPPSTEKFEFITTADTFYYGICTTDERINFADENTFYSFNTATGEKNFWHGDFTVNTRFYGVKETEGGLEYYFTVTNYGESRDTVDIWKYSTEKEYSEVIKKDVFYNYEAVLSPDLRHFIERKEENGRHYLKVSSFE